MSAGQKSDAPPTAPTLSSAVRVALYYDASQRFNVFRREEPYPFRRLYAIGQDFILDSKGWSVINAWIGQGGVYHVICAPGMPKYLADMLRESTKRNNKADQRHE